MSCVSAKLSSTPTNSNMEHKQNRKQPSDFRGSKGKYILIVFTFNSFVKVKPGVKKKGDWMLFSQHLQVMDKRTCWHGNAGGGLSADPKNVVSESTMTNERFMLLCFTNKLVILQQIIVLSHK